MERFLRLATAIASRENAPRVHRTGNRFRPRPAVLGAGRDRPGARTRGLDALATFKAQPQDTSALKHARLHVHQAPGAIQMVGLDAVVAYTDEIERQLARLEQLPAAAVPGRGRPRRPRVPQAAHLPRRAGQRRAAGAAEAVPRVRGDAARARRARRDADRPLLSRPVRARAAHRRCARRRRRRSCRRTSSSSAAPTSTACSRGCAATRTGARRMRDAIAGIEDADDAVRACARSGGPSARCSRRWPSTGVDAGFGAEAARRAHRPADPPRRRGRHQGRRPAAARGALLRRDQRAGRARRCGGAEGVQAGEPHPIGRDARHRRRAPAAADARGARAARRRQGHVAQVRVRARGEPAEAQADARLGARARRRR